MNRNFRTLLSEARDVIRKKETSLQHLALDLGLRRGHTDYTRFIILARSRTGSNLLRGLLMQHSRVLSFGEIFRSPEVIDFDLPGYEPSRGALALYRRDPVRFLATQVFRRVPVRVQAVGFKLFYYHARAQPWQAIWECLHDLAELRVIHLRRRNILRTHLSRARAERSDRWVNLSGEAEDKEPLELNYEACLKDFIQTRQWEQAADEHFAAHAKLVVCYEDLAEDYQREMARLAPFLGLLDEPLAPQTRKQAQQPLRAAIANYAALKQQFAGSEWEVFFEE
ncbi:MAG: sulfotransferase [Anaerolineales bacterium]|nr:sulfotransferase [Anaerolineales bacterium]